MKKKKNQALAARDLKEESGSHGIPYTSEREVKFCLNLRLNLHIHLRPLTFSG